jgi:hypothetical protein
MPINGSPNNAAPRNGFQAPSTLARSRSGYPVDVSGSVDDVPADRVVPPTSEPPPVPERWTPPESESLEQEQERLEAAIAIAKARIVAADVRVTAHVAEVRTSLRAEFANARETLAEMERRHDSTVGSMRATAHMEIERILADARRAVGGPQSGLLSAGHRGAIDAE